MINERDKVIEIFLSSYKGGCSCFPENYKDLEEHYQFHFDGKGNRFERPSIARITEKERICVMSDNSIEQKKRELLNGFYAAKLRSLEDLLAGYKNGLEDREYKACRGRIEYLNELIAEILTVPDQQKKD